MLKLQQMKQRDELMVLYSANISHEMRTPLSTIINFSSMMMATEKDPEKRKYLKIMNFSAILMLKNVNDNLDKAQIERGTFRPNQEEGTLNDALAQVIAVLEMKAEAFNVKLALQVATDIRLSFDKQRVQQMSMNLLSNAVKFSKDSKILVNAFVTESKDPSDIDRIVKNHYLVTDAAEAAEMRKLLSEPGAFIHIGVVDFGVGISSKNQSLLFKEFSTIGDSKRLNPNGVGLGLSICKKIVRQLGGDIRLVKSATGKGSVFQFFVKAEKLDNVVIDEEVLKDFEHEPLVGEVTPLSSYG